MKNVAIFGSTGSIGKQALEVIKENPHLYKVNFISANNNIIDLVKQVIEFKPKYVCMANKKNYSKLIKHISADTKILLMDEFSVEVLQDCGIDICLVAIPGFAGVMPTIESLKLGKTVALANKESLVVAGNIIMELVNKHKVSLVPVDSEHSAIFQCLLGEEKDNVEKIILSCSGGPFFGKNIEEINACDSETAGNHPVWSMGKGITIDSATLMNKAFEIIEAKWLFDLEPQQIECIIHPECIIHSSVLFKDGSSKAQFGFPDMKVPISYALSYPNRVFSNNKKFSFSDIGKLSFFKPDKNTFKSLTLAYIALEKGGNMSCALNAANEIARDLYYKNKINLSQFYDILYESLEKTKYIASPKYEDYIDTDKQVREICCDIYKKKHIFNNKLYK